MDARTMSERTRARIDRRAFVGTLGAAVCGLAAATVLPVSAEAALLPARPAPYSMIGPMMDWTIDDMAGLYPRYADAIVCARPQVVVIDHVDPLDCLFG